MRDALSLLDQAIAYGGGEVREPAVRAMLGAVDRELPLSASLDALLARRRRGAARGSRRARARAAWRSRRRSTSSRRCCTAIAVAQVGARRLPTRSTTRERDRALRGAHVSPKTVQLAYQIALQGRADLALAPDEATGFTMTLLRLLAFEPGGAPRRRAPADRPAASPQAEPSARAAARPSPRPREPSQRRERPAAIRAHAVAPASPQPRTSATPCPAADRAPRAGRACTRCRRRGAMAGVRRGAEARRHGGSARRADRAQVACKDDALALRSPESQRASRRQGVRREAEGGARRGTGTQGAARFEHRRSRRRSLAALERRRARAGAGAKARPLSATSRSCATCCRAFRARPCAPIRVDADSQLIRIH